MKCPGSNQVFDDSYRSWRYPAGIPIKECPHCGAKRKLQLVKRSMGRRGSGIYEDFLIFPHHKTPQPKKNKVTIEKGCKGCNRYWFETEPENCPPEQHNKEGMCCRCKRCHACCGDRTIPYTCAWKASFKTPEQKWRSQRAYDRWLENPAILGHNRRIT